MLNTGSIKVEQLRGELLLTNTGAKENDEPFQIGVHWGYSPRRMIW